MRLDIARLIVPRRGAAVFHFERITHRNAAIVKQIGRLLVQPRAIERRKKRSERRDHVYLIVARLESTQAMLPVRSGLKIPGQSRSEIVQPRALSRHKKSRTERRLPRLTCVAGTISQRQPKRVGVRKLPAEIAPQGRVAEKIVRPLPIAVEISRARGI